MTISIIYTLIVFNGYIDDFSPKHATAFEQICNRSHLDQKDYTTKEIPGYLVLGAIIKLVSNISSIGFLTYPLQLLPILTIFYVFTSKISNSPIFSCAATFLYIGAGTMGTDKIFFWPHGVGSVLYFVALFSISSIMLAPSHRKSEFILLFIICGCSLGFLSYNLFAGLILFLFSIILNMLIFQNRKINFAFKKYSLFLNCLLIFITTQLGLSRFVYDSFIPMLKVSSDLDVSAAEKFFSAYIYKISNPEIPYISELLINFLPIITVISALKYLILCISIFIFISLYIKKVYKKADISIFDLFTVSILMSELLYFFIRTYIGDIAVTSIFLPGMLCIIWLYQNTNKFQNYAKFAILVLLILTPSYTYIIETSDLRNQQIYENEYLKASSSWYFENKGDNIGVSDEMSRNLISMFIFEKYNYSYEIKILSLKDAGFLVQKLNSKDYQKYYLINYQLRRMSLQNWVIIKTWRLFKNSIDSNKHICKIYDLDSVSIYY